MDSDAVRFLKAYNDVTAGVTSALRMRPRPLTGKAAKEAEAYLAWAVTEGVDPVLFMRARHEAATGARVPVSRLGNASPGFLAKYREWGEWKQSKVATEERYAAVDDDDPEVELVPLHEAARAALIGSPLVCMSSLTITGGWHPASSYCPTCPSGKACRAGLSTKTRRRRDWGDRVRSK
tara:strand:+ start:2441 stop:2977 length:537 start_codon:yes stop_codon:yes gene_type:complete